MADTKNGFGYFGSVLDKQQQPQTGIVQPQMASIQIVPKTPAPLQAAPTAATASPKNGGMQQLQTDWSNLGNWVGGTGEANGKDWAGGKLWKDANGSLNFNSADGMKYNFGASSLEDVAKKVPSIGKAWNEHYGLNLQTNDKASYDPTVSSNGTSPSGLRTWASGQGATDGSMFAQQAGWTKVPTDQLYNGVYLSSTGQAPGALADGSVAASYKAGGDVYDTGKTGPNGERIYYSNGQLYYNDKAGNLVGARNLYGYDYNNPNGAAVDQRMAQELGIPVQGAQPGATAPTAGAATGSMGATQPGTGSGATGSTTGAAAGTTGSAQTGGLVENYLNNILAQDSTYLQRARAKALETANARGLANSSMAAGAGEAAALDAALPMAQQDASMNQQKMLQDTSQRFQKDLATLQNTWSNARYDTQLTEQLQQEYRTAYSNLGQEFMQQIQQIQQGSMLPEEKTAAIQQLTTARNNRISMLNAVYSNLPRWRSEWSTLAPGG